MTLWPVTAEATVADEKMNTPSEAVRPATVPPPVPSVWM